MADYILLEVGLHGAKVSPEEAATKVMLVLREAFDFDFQDSVDVDIIAHTPGPTYPHGD